MAALQARPAPLRILICYQQQVASPETLLARVRESVTAISAPLPAPPPGERPAAVLLLFDPSSDRLPLLFTLRSPRMRQHAGQIAFPGGSAEPDDRDLIATALREAHEEVGVEPANVEVLGLLAPLSTQVSDVWLTPVVGLQRHAYDIAVDPDEVAEWFRIDLDALLAAPHRIRVLERDGVRHDVHFYDAAGRVIWGVTGAIVHDLLARLGRTG
jgi:8-oxo-dGTP pyrophosphatase MutT (NUDIX family)